MLLRCFIFHLIIVDYDFIVYSARRIINNDKNSQLYARPITVLQIHPLASFPQNFRR